MKRLILILTTLILFACGPSKKKAEITTVITKDVEVERIDTKSINSVLDSQLKLFSQYSDNSKIKITFYSTELDSSGKQLIDKIVEQENDITTNTNSDVTTKENTNTQQNTIDKTKDKSIIDTQTKVKEKKSGFDYRFYIFGIGLILLLIYIIIRKLKTIKFKK
jgi:uncharacterized membrane protein YdfJ with MMPL/SSD domain